MQKKLDLHILKNYQVSKFRHFFSLDGAYFVEFILTEPLKLHNQEIPKVQLKFEFFQGKIGSISWKFHRKYGDL